MENTENVQEPVQQPAQKEVQPTFVIQQAPAASNAMGTAGFIIALVTIFLFWIPVLGWILWLLGLIFSGIGVTRKPKGLAIAGLVISLIGLILLIVVLGLLAAAVALDQ
jgi:hypothetical protein